MKKIVIAVLLLGCLPLFVSCAGGGGRRGGGVYHHYHGRGPWWGSRSYYRDTIIIDTSDVVEAILPSGPEMMPDMGMPDIDLGD